MKDSIHGANDSDRHVPRVDDWPSLVGSLALIVMGVVVPLVYPDAFASTAGAGMATIGGALMSWTLSKIRARTAAQSVLRPELENLSRHLGTLSTRLIQVVRSGLDGELESDPCLRLTEQLARSLQSHVVDVYYLHGGAVDSRQLTDVFSSISDLNRKLEEFERAPGTNESPRGAAELDELRESVRSIRDRLANLAPPSVSVASERRPGQVHVPCPSCDTTTQCTIGSQPGDSTVAICRACGERFNVHRDGAGEPFAVSNSLGQAPSQHGVLIRVAQEYPSTEVANYVERAASLTGAPRIGTEAITAVLEALAEEVSVNGFSITRTSRVVRDRCRSAGVYVARDAVNFVIRSISFAGFAWPAVAAPIEVDQLLAAHRRNMEYLCRGAGLLARAEDRTAFDAWIPRRSGRPQIAPSNDPVGATLPPAASSVAEPSRPPSLQGAPPQSSGDPAGESQTAGDTKGVSEVDSGGALDPSVACPMCRALTRVASVTVERPQRSCVCGSCGNIVKVKYSESGPQFTGRVISPDSPRFSAVPLEEARRLIRFALCTGFPVETRVGYLRLFRAISAVSLEHSLSHPVAVQHVCEALQRDGLRMHADRVAQLISGLTQCGLSSAGDRSIAAVRRAFVTCVRELLPTIPGLDSPKEIEWAASLAAND